MPLLKSAAKTAMDHGYTHIQNANYQLFSLEDVINSRNGLGKNWAFCTRNDTHEQTLVHYKNGRIEGHYKLERLA